MLRYENLPLKDLKEIGYGRNKLLSLGKNLEYLMLGKRTEVLPIELSSETTGEIKQFKARLSIAEDEHNSLNIHLVQEEFVKPSGITQEQYEHLKSGKILKRIITTDNGNQEVYLYQKDKETNELLKVRLDDINYSFSADQLDDIQDGKPVEIGNTIINIDLSKPEGFVVGNSINNTREQSLETIQFSSNDSSISR